MPTDDVKDIRHGIVNANVHGWTALPPPMDNGHFGAGMRTLPFMGNASSSSIVVAAGQTLRLVSALYNYNGPIMYTLGATGSAVDTANIMWIGSSTVIPWTDKTMAEAGYVSGTQWTVTNTTDYDPTPLSNPGPYGQFAGGWIAAEVSALAGSYGEGVAIGQNEKIGIGYASGVNDIPQFGTAGTAAGYYGGLNELNPDNLPFWDCDLAVENTLGACSLLKDRTSIVGAGGEAATKSFYAAVMPSTSKFMHLSDTVDMGVSVHSMGSVRLTGTLAGGEGGSINPGSAGWGVATGVQYQKISDIRIRERLAYANPRTALFAGSPVIEITCTVGTLVVRLNGAAGYHMNTPRTHALYHFAANQTPHDVTTQSMISNVASHAGQGPSTVAAITDARINTLIQFGADTAVKTAINAVPVTDVAKPATATPMPVSHLQPTDQFISTVLGNVPAEHVKVADNSISGWLGWMASGAVDVVKGIGKGIIRELPNLLSVTKGVAKIVNKDVSGVSDVIDGGVGLANTEYQYGSGKKDLLIDAPGLQSMQQSGDYFAQQGYLTAGGPNAVYQAIPSYQGQPLSSFNQTTAVPLAYPLATQDGIPVYYNPQQGYHTADGPKSKKPSKRLRSEIDAPAFRSDPYDVWIANQQEAQTQFPSAMSSRTARSRAIDAEIAQQAQEYSDMQKSYARWQRAGRPV